MRPKIPAILAVLAAASVPAAPARATSCVSAPAPLTFRPPVFVDTERAGGEPVSVVADDGSILVAAHRGDSHLYLRTAPEALWYAQYQDQVFVWRSADDGDTWQRVEVLPGVSMHSPTSSGFSDPDLTKDAAGNLYGTEQNGEVNISVFSSQDHGVTWPDANPVSAVGPVDRPWVAGRGPGEVYLQDASGLRKSTDGGRTWSGRESVGGHGRLQIDPTNPNGLFMPVYGGVAVSRDDGFSWDYEGIPDQVNDTEIPTVGVDTEGWAYRAWMRGRSMRLGAFSPAGRWSLGTIPRPGGGDPFWPWVVAGDAGRVAVGWYESTLVDRGIDPLGETARFEIRAYVAVTTNARGTVCPDGTTVPALFSVADAIGRPVHSGAEPCWGLGCTVASRGGDRRLGDFFTINFDAAGRVFVTSGDTTLKGPGGIENQVSRPVFAIAGDAAPRLRA